MYNVASNVEVVGQSQCQLNGGAATPRASEWEYADGSTVALKNVQCRGMTNAECCDAIWAYGEQLGPDTNGYQLPGTAVSFLCGRKWPPTHQVFRLRRLRDGSLHREELSFCAYQKIDHLLGPTALTGYCSDAQGNDQNSGVVVLNRGERAVALANYEGGTPRCP
jgi:hypothetical protein